ncbi:MAG: HK97 family phage prohead protease [Sphingobium sp.]|uniref:HK97 family phage prohead protease n=1 Tax=Sphingobium sp. TaxID=1912891 RepID=UPI0029AD2845|nr:HK97 family phage prohead protease [Sphingobium sp.]MDX3908415.1 HK97 family phage prohead protease [Sphingobium sp.]
MPATKPPKSDGRETRAVSLGLEVRAAAVDGDARTASGYAALFNSETDIGGYWRETIAPGAFTKSLAERDVVALHSHDSGRVVGRKDAGTLTLREDSKGLAFENELPDTSDGRDLAVQIDRGDIPGMSFGFVTRKQEWDETVDPPHRTIIEADLYEITYTAFPAYPDTTVGLRSLEHVRNERDGTCNACLVTRNAQRRARLEQIERNIR